jgi:hypothetical protein
VTGLNPPKTPVTKGSSGIAAATVPNVCKMPGPPAPFVPTPLPNIGKSGNSPDGYSTTVTIEGDPVAIKGASFKSMGDVASQGTGGGIVSNNVEGPTKFVGPGSMDVKIEGKNVQQFSDPMLNNCGPSGSPANSATLAGLVQGTATKAFADAIGDKEIADKLCDAACKAKKKKLKPGQTRQGEMCKAFTKSGPLHTASDPSILPEVSQVIPSEPGGRIKTLLSTTGRTVAGSGGAKAPMSMFKAMSMSTPEAPVTRWDFVIPADPSKAANPSNVSKYVEVKFKGDELTKNQEKMREMMDPEVRDAKVVEMDPDKDCKCK